MKATVEVRRQFKTFLEVFLHGQGEETIKCDFAQDSPFRLQKTIHQDEFGIYTDNAFDIACNKLSALFDRSEAKDFIDIFFIDRELLRFDDLLEQAKQKHVGLDDYWLAVSLLKVQDLGPLPRMVKQVKKKDLQNFFLTKAKTLMN